MVLVQSQGALHAALQVFRRVLERRAPEGLSRIEQLIAPDHIGQGTYVRNITDEVLDALTAAHREAAGKL